MVQLLLIQSFQNTGRLLVVASSHQTFATDFLLLSNLRKFQVQKDAFGDAASDRRARGDFTTHAAPNTRRNHAFREGNSGQFRLDRSGHSSL